MHFDADLNAAWLGDLGGFHEHVAHQNMVFLFGGPVGLAPFVGVNNIRAALDGEADRLFEILGADFRLAQGAVGG